MRDPRRGDSCRRTFPVPMSGGRVRLEQMVGVVTDYHNGCISVRVLEIDGDPPKKRDREYMDSYPDIWDGDWLND